MVNQDLLTAADFAGFAITANEKLKHTAWWRFKERYRLKVIAYNYSLHAMMRIQRWRDETLYSKFDDE